MELNINMKSRNLAKMFCPQSKHIIQRTGSISPGEGRVFTGRYWGSDGGRWWSRRTCAHFLYNSLLNNHGQENVGSHQKKIPHIQGQRRSTTNMVGGMKSSIQSNSNPPQMLGRLKQNLVTTTRPCRD